MINKGKPASETDLGKRVNQEKSLLLQETRNWLRGWIPFCHNDREFGNRYKQILKGLTDLINKLYTKALGDFEPIIFINNCLSYCNLNPDASIGSIKYLALYLETIFNDIYLRLESEEGQQNLAETVNPRKPRKRKEKREEFDAQFRKDWDLDKDDSGF